MSARKTKRSVMVGVKASSENGHSNGSQKKAGAASKASRVALSPAILGKAYGALSIPEQLDQAIEEARLFMHQSLAGEGSDDQAFRFRVAAEGFLVAAFNRFKKIAPVDAYHKFGYTRAEMGEIRSTIIDLQGVRTGRLQLDKLLEGLVYQARALVESQTTMCQHCEHCIRKHPELVDHELEEREALPDEAFKHLLRVLRDDCAEDATWVLLLRHLEALAWNGRTSAVGSAVTEIIEAMISPQDAVITLAHELEEKAKNELPAEMERWARMSSDE